MSWKDRLKMMAHSVGALVVGVVSGIGGHLLSSTDVVSAILIAAHVPPATVPIIMGAVTTAIGYNVKTPKQQITESNVSSQVPPPVTSVGK
jgi:hypothetical protein